MASSDNIEESEEEIRYETSAKNQVRFNKDRMKGTLQ